MIGRARIKLATDLDGLRLDRFTWIVSGTGYMDWTWCEFTWIEPGTGLHGLDLGRVYMDWTWDGFTWIESGTGLHGLNL